MLLAHAVGALFDPLQNVEGRGEIVGVYPSVPAPYRQWLAGVDAVVVE
jgi:hypothetical protein